MGRCLSEMWHLDTAQDIASVIGTFVDKRERGESIWKNSGSLTVLTRKLKRGSGACKELGKTEKHRKIHYSSLRRQDK